MRLFEGTPYDQPPKCDRCGALEADCTCPPPPAARIPPEKQVASLAVEKRRRGKIVTVIRGLSATASDLPALLSLLKSQCGAGGTLDEEGLEIQGQHIDRIRAALSDLGYRVKG
jgi:translation initiation factor 1